MDEKAVRRAGLDYWKHVDLREHGRCVLAVDRRVHLFDQGNALHTGPVPARGRPRIWLRDQGMPKALVETMGRFASRFDLRSGRSTFRTRSQL